MRLVDTARRRGLECPVRPTLGGLRLPKEQEPPPTLERARAAAEDALGSTVPPHHAALVIERQDALVRAALDSVLRVSGRAAPPLEGGPTDRRLSCAIRVHIRKGIVADDPVLTAPLNIADRCDERMVRLSELNCAAPAGPHHRAELCRRRLALHHVSDHPELRAAAKDLGRGFVG